MNPLYLPGTDDIREQFAEMREDQDDDHYILDKTKAGVLEITACQFLCDKPTIFGKPTQDYIDRELQWYLSMSQSIRDFPPPVPKIWQKVADNDGFVNSNYGELVYGIWNDKQFYFCRDELQRNRDSRRAVMIYTRPQMQEQYNKNGRNDFVCTNVVQYFIRRGKLHAYVQMRSCDAIFGYPNDYAWQRYVFQHLLRELKLLYTDLEEGEIIWNAGSFHIYDRHFYLIDYYMITGKWDVDKKEMKRWTETQKSGMQDFSDSLNS